MLLWFVDIQIINFLYIIFKRDFVINAVLFFYFSFKHLFYCYCVLYIVNVAVTIFDPPSFYVSSMPRLGYIKVLIIVGTVVVLIVW